MSRSSLDPDDFEDEFEEDGDAPDAADLGDDDDDLPEMQCPNCHRRVVEDTQKCPHCGDWIEPVAVGSGGWRRWIFVAIIVLMVMLVLRWVL